MIECKTLRQVVTSATEAETAAVFNNERNAIQVKYFLECLDHKQPTTPVKTNNFTTNGYVHNIIQQRKSK